MSLYYTLMIVIVFWGIYEKFKFVSLEFIFSIVSDFHVQIKKKN